MNKRITALVDQIAEETPGVYNLVYESGDRGVEFTEQALQKFAELLIKDIAMFSMVITDDHYDVSALYRHYGVEE